MPGLVRTALALAASLADGARPVTPLAERALARGEQAAAL